MRYKILGFRRFAKCVARRQGSYRLIGSLLRTPQHFIPPPLGTIYNMISKTTLVLISIFFILTKIIISQTVDTLIIIENKASIPIDTILTYLYTDKYFSDRNFSIAQNGDLIPLFSSRNRTYLKFYDSKGKLILEGLKNEHCDFEGHVKYYYKNGRVRRIEYWNDTLNYQVKDGLIYSGSSQSYKPEGIWYYYSKDGALKSTTEYHIDKIPESQNVCYFYVVIQYAKNQTIKSTKQVILNCL